MSSIKGREIRVVSPTCSSSVAPLSLRCHETEPSAADATTSTSKPNSALQAPEAGAAPLSRSNSTSLNDSQLTRTRSHSTTTRRIPSSRASKFYFEPNSIFRTPKPIFILLIGLLVIGCQPTHARSIKDAKANKLLDSEAVECAKRDCVDLLESEAKTSQPTTESPQSTLGDFLARLTSAFGAEQKPTIAPAHKEQPETTTEAPEEAEAEEEDDSTSAGDDDNDAESCEGLSTHESAEAKNLTDHERLVKLQACLQGKIKRRMKGSTLTGMKMFEQLSLSGGCSNSLMNLAMGMTEVKAYAFKFLDATAKIPSGFMYGLLSDFGDFDQCLSIRSNPRVLPENEVEEGAFSGKYCLLSLKMNYHIRLKPNETVPEGIDPDGVLWDELVRNYWTSNTTKGFQIGVCVPSRCSNEDLEQIYRYVAESYNIHGEVMSCQDSNDLKKQLTPDLLQRVIIYTAMVLFVLSILGTLLERYFLKLILERSSSLKAQASSSTSLEDSDDPLTTDDTTGKPPTPSRCRTKQTDFFVSLCQNSRLNTVLNILICFSLRRNWNIFISKRNSSQDLLNSNQWLSRDTHSSFSSRNSASQQRQVGGKITKWPRQTTELTTANTITADECDSATMPTSLSSTTLSSSEQATKSIDSLDNAATRLSGPPANISHLDSNKFSQLLVKIHQPDYSITQMPSARYEQEFSRHTGRDPSDSSTIGHLSGLKLLVIVWITIGHSFLYPSANNYQYYRSIINMNITRDSVWFATTNFTLGIDMLLYMSGLLFVYKLARLNSRSSSSSVSLFSSLLNTSTQQQQLQPPKDRSRRAFGFLDVLQMIARKVLRFWPTYLSVIALAIVIPLVSDGPMWPEMVQKRLGETCRRNFWANLLIVNNMFFSESDICLPSSWFVSVLMQLFLIGSLIILLAKRVSLRLACAVSVMLLACSAAVSFALAYHLNLSAPVIRMDESFVLELDGRIFTMYINLFNNMGPFMVGLIGGLLLLKHETQARRRRYQKSNSSRASTTPNSERQSERGNKILAAVWELLLAVIVATIAACVLSSVFFNHYTRFWASFYWAFHRIGWSIATGYVIHQCATGQWKLLYDLLSLSTFIPLSKLVFIAYLVYPIYIHVHSGFVRDGLHVSIYNMMNIYVTRLVLTFSTALMIHLFVELPFCSLEEMFLQNWLSRLIRRRTKLDKAVDELTGEKKVDMKRVESSSSSELSNMGEESKMSKFHPLLAVVESKIDENCTEVVESKTCEATDGTTTTT